MRAEIEWLASDTAAGVRTGCLRIGANDFSHERHDDFHRSCTIVGWLGAIPGDPDMIEIKGWTGRITAAEWRAMEECFQREGYGGFYFDRKTKNGKIRRHVTVFPA